MPEGLVGLQNDCAVGGGDSGDDGDGEANEGRDEGVPIS
jgi:hypothetical protein